MLKTLSGTREASRRPFVRPALTAVPLLLLSAWAAINWYHSAQNLIRDYNPLPFEDYWRVVQDLGQYKSFDLRFLWKPHNEHRILFPEIVFACDMLLARGRRLLPLILSCFCYFGVLITIGGTLFRDEKISVSVRWAAFLLAALVMGWKGNAFVLAEPFLLQWTLTQVSVVAALVLICGKNATGLAASITAAVVATYSSGNGMLVWPILIGAGLLLKLSRKHITVLIVAGSLAIGLYFIGYESPSRLHIGSFFSHPIYSLEFVGAYMSMPFGGMKGPRFGAYLGVISLAIMIILFASVVRRNFAQWPVIIVLFGCYSFAVLTAILTAAGRMNPTDAHYSGAESVRYLTLPLVSWAAFVSAAIWVSARLHWKTFNPWIIAIVISMLLLVGFPKLRWWFRDNQGRFVQGQLATLSVENGITDSNLMAMLFPDPGLVRRYLPELKNEHLSIYSGAKNDVSGKPLESVGKVIAVPAPGRISYSFPVEHGLEVAGFCGYRQDCRVMLANEKREIVGFGESLPAGFPAQIPVPEASSASNWIGFANLTYPSNSISAYAITPSGLVPLGGSAVVPAIRPVNDTGTGSLIPTITWRTEPSGLTDRIPMTFIINPPGPIYSTWQSGPEQKAAIESSVFATPPGQCVVVPVLTGPSIQGLSVNVVNHASGQAVASVPMQDRSRWWAFWRVPIPPGADRVRIMAEDRGVKWGQWVAIAAPHECR